MFLEKPNNNVNPKRNIYCAVWKIKSYKVACNIVNIEVYGEESVEGEET